MFFVDIFERLFYNISREKNEIGVYKMNKTHNMKSKITRRKRILELLEQDKALCVADLSEIFQTSVVTIRKDLAALEEEGLLSRTHGGAVTGAVSQQEQSYNVRKNKNRDVKVAIAEAAAELVKDGDSLFIPTGSTCAYAFDFIADKHNVIVISNSLRLFNQAANRRNVSFFFLGGRFDHDLQITVGDDVLPQLSKYTVDKLIMGADALSTSGISSFQLSGDFILKQMIRQSRERILVADSSKIGKVAFAHFADLTDFDILVTNYDPEAENLLNEIRHMGIQVITV